MTWQSQSNPRVYPTSMSVAVSEQDAERLVLAIPKKGRLADRACKLLIGAGLAFDRCVLDSWKHFAERLLYLELFIIYYLLLYALHGPLL